MGIDINSEVARACVIMSRYRMSQADQKEVAHILLSAGVDHCLTEQERLRAEKEVMIQTVQSRYQN